MTSTKNPSQSGAPWDGENAQTLARNITLDVFANDESASVQVRLTLPRPSESTV